MANKRDRNFGLFFTTKQQKKTGNPSLFRIIVIIQ